MEVFVLGWLVLYVLLIFLFYKTWIGIEEFYLSNSNENSPYTFISVIIAARNEEGRISTLLKSLIHQTYSINDFEVIVVDDESDDYTREVVESVFSKSDLNYKILSTNRKYGSGKKAALRTGIEKANGQLIVTTDADCQMNEKWISTIEAFYRIRNLKMVIGPVAILRGDTIFSRMQSIEFASLIGSGAATFKLGIPTMCNGANLAFSKEVFFSVNGYEDNLHLASGDDEFLMHKVSEKYPGKVAFLKNKDAVVKTQGMPDLESFFNQRVRWGSKWGFYKSVKPKLLALFIFISNLLLLLGIFLSIGGKIDLIFFILVIGLKVLMEFIFLKNITDFCREPMDFKAFGLLSIIYSWYIVLFALLSRRKSFVWKDRKVM